MTGLTDVYSAEKQLVEALLKMAKAGGAAEGHCVTLWKEPGTMCLVFATVRHGTRQSKGRGSRVAIPIMVFKRATQAARHWRRLNGHQLIANFIQGVKFTDGVMENAGQRSQEPGYAHEPVHSI